MVQPAAYDARQKGLTRTSVHVDHSCMAGRTKRMYTGHSSSHDVVSDRALEELDHAVQDEAEAGRWTEAAHDLEFATEAAQIAAEFDEPDRSLA